MAKMYMYELYNTVSTVVLLMNNTSQSRNFNEHICTEHCSLLLHYSFNATILEEELMLTTRVKYMFEANMYLAAQIHKALKCF